MNDIVVHPQTLGALKVALQSTQANTEQSDRSVTIAADRVVAGIRSAVVAREATVRQREHALEACLRSDREDCSVEAAALGEARRRLAAAQRSLALATRGVADYRSRSTSIRRRLEQTTSEGMRYLNHKLAKVTAVNAGSGGARGTAAGSAVGGPSAGGLSAASASGPSDLGVHTLPGLPAGCVMVPVSMIDQTELPIHGPQDFGKGYSIEDFDHAFDLLEERILPALADGAHPDSFSAHDQANGVYGTRSLADTYSGFLNSADNNVIRLELRPDGMYKISNGRHRIYVASQYGRAFVPAFLSGGQP